MDNGKYSLFLPFKEFHLCGGVGLLHCKELFQCQFPNVQYIPFSVEAKNFSIIVEIIPFKN